MSLKKLKESEKLGKCFEKTHSVEKCSGKKSLSGQKKVKKNIGSKNM